VPYRVDGEVRSEAAASVRLAGHRQQALAALHCSVCSHTLHKGDILSGPLGTA